MLIAEVVPPQALALVPLMTTALTFAAAAGMLWLYRHSFSRLLTGLGAAFEGVKVGRSFYGGTPLAFIGRRLYAIDRAIITAFETYIRGAEIAMGLYWSVIADSFTWVGQEIADLSETVAGSMARVVRHSIPSAENRAVARAKQQAAPATIATTHTTVVTLPRIKAHSDTLADRVGQLSGTLGRLGQRVRANEKRLAAGATAAAVMVALRSMGLGSLRCGNIRRNLKRFCGLNPAVLDALFIGSLALAGPVSVERMTRELLGQMDAFEAALRRGFTEL